MSLINKNKFCEKFERCGEKSYTYIDHLNASHHDLVQKLYQQYPYEEYGEVCLISVMSENYL